MMNYWEQLLEKAKANHLNYKKEAIERFDKPGLNVIQYCYACITAANRRI